MAKRRIVVIGGSAAGAKAAAKARRIDPIAEVTLIQREADLSMASCGYPYYISGLFDERNALLATPTGVVRNPQFFHKAKRITALIGTEVIGIDRQRKQVLCYDLKKESEHLLQYDKLIVCTGATARVLPVSGQEFEGVTTLLSMADTDYLRKVNDDKLVKHAVILGGGLIGIETAEALRSSGMEITLIEMAEDILTFLDPQLAKLTANHMRAKGVEVLTGKAVSAILGEAGKVVGVKLADDRILHCELVVVAAGVTPNVNLARDSGLEIGTLGGILVDDCMLTSDPDIYAAGDCVEVKHLLTGENVLAPMGDLANLQGRVAGENAASSNVAYFPGTIHTAICKVFDFAAGSTGLTEQVARRSGYNNIETVINASPDKPGFMGAKLLISKIVVDKNSNQLIGYQSVGSGDVSRQIATAAMAIQAQMRIEQLTCLDLPYAPPFSLAIDHFISSVHIVENKLKGRLTTINAEEVQIKLEKGEVPFFLDARAPDEYEEMRLGIGEKLIPLGALREKLEELPLDKESEIICYCKISLRGYEAALVLKDAGYKNVKVLDGGIMSWPYTREK